MMKYATLAELREAYRFPEGQRPNPLMIDNDSVSATTGNDEDGNYEDVFEMHPADVLEQALALLGIPSGHA